MALLIFFRASVSGLIPALHAGRVHRLHPVAVGHVRALVPAPQEGWARGLLINGLSALTTGVVMVVVGVSNFFEGAWLVIVLVPILMIFLSGIRRHYRSLDERLALERIPAGKEVAAEPIVIVPVARLDRTARQAIAFANSISKTATAVHITNNPDSAAEQARALARLGGRDGAGGGRVAVSGPGWTAAPLPGRVAGPGSRPAGAGRAVRGGAAPLVGEPAAQPDGAAPEAVSSPARTRSWPTSPTAPADES